MSLAETQQIYDMLVKIDAILNGIETKSETLIKQAPRMAEAKNTFHDTERLALRWLAVARKMGLPENVEQATQVVTSLVVMFKMLDISISMLSGGGIRSLIGIAGIVSVVLTANDMIGYDALRGY